ncbi:UDP-N-acetylmuramate dehydrogenase [Balneolales bacterium ANBcel1]|nr:UDP-N-acetylmuramate dehydrogenase [Balneolales bacterium ANBcel1]
MRYKSLNIKRKLEISKLVRGGIEEDVDLSKISRWKIGGIADCLVRPTGTEEVSSVIKYLYKHDLPYVVIGSTSNILFSDDGLRAVCIQIGNDMSDYHINNTNVWAQSGVWVPGFAKNVAKAKLSGIEHTVGIPGTLGGLVCMNGGSQRKDIGRRVISVTAVSPQGEVVFFSNADCCFGYRTSVFQRNGNIITEIELAFDKNQLYEVIRDEMLEILKSRRKKFPNKMPNCGSTFISNSDLYNKIGPPGKIIEELGFKGYRVGDAVVSNEHGNFINNLGNAKSNDVLQIIKNIRLSIIEKTGVAIDAEVIYVTPNGKLLRAHLVDI